MERVLLSELELHNVHACVYQLYGRDARDMMRCMSGGGDSAEALEMLACRCVTLDGKALDLPTLEELPFDDYLELIKAVQVNFTHTELKDS